MAQTAFDPRPLPDGVGRALRDRLSRAHAEAPFSPLDPRATVQRVTELLAGLPLRPSTFRGGVDLRGVEVDHVWLALGPDIDAEQPPVWVIDVAFPLFQERFVAVLRRFVAGDATSAELADTAGSAGFEERILGEFPAAVRYLGQPIWSARWESA